MATGLGKRIRDARELRNKSQEEVARACGVTRAAISQWEQGSSAPTIDKMEPLCEVLDVNPVWLLTGAHDKWAKPSKEVGVATIAVPEYDVRVSAGGGFAIAAESKRDTWLFSRHYLVDELRLPAAQLFVVEVIGDSMTPTLHSGDRVLVNMGDKRVSQPGIFVLWDGDGTVVKRLELVPNSKPQKLRRISDNPLHKDYEVLAGDTIIIGRAVWFARRM